MKPYKVVGIGLNKTGTKTLAACLRILGYERNISVQGDLLAKYRDGYLDDIFDIVEDNETFEDWPWPLCYKEIFYRFGDKARYILTKRKDPYAWLESLKRHSLRTAPDRHCRLLAYGYNYPHGLEAYHLNFYRKHNVEVVNFFEFHNSSHLLLEVTWELGDSWEKLCAFLNEPVPAINFPHENRGSDPIDKTHEEENTRRINQQLRILFRINEAEEGLRSRFQDAERRELDAEKRLHLIEAEKQKLEEQLRQTAEQLRKLKKTPLTRFERFLRRPVSLRK